ncbi:MAG: TolC family protein [Campylobacterota bacterium]|nr:TolC family protein [Campylobacterota bacterium]
MRTLLLIFLLLASSLYSITLDEIINASLSKSPSLEAIQARVQANRQNINASSQFSNPQLLLSTNTLDNSQAMSQTLLTLKQKIAYYGKRDSNQKMALTQEKVLQQKLQNAKVLLVGQIKNEAYSIWELQELYKIIEEYIKLTRRNIELYESYATISENQHMGIMQAELSLSELKIQKNSLKREIYSAYSRLSYLSAVNVENLEITLLLDKKPKLSDLKNITNANPDILLKERELQEQNAKLEIATLNNYPDINLIAGYSYRKNFDDFLNLGVGLSLPIYSTEEYKEEEQRALLLSSKSQKEDIKMSVDSRVKIYYAQMLSSYEIYHIIHDETLPKLSHMFELANSSISTGGDLFKYINVLFSKLKLEQKSINSVANYKRAQAQISQLAGEIK